MTAIVAAAGRGSRLGVRKQLLDLCGKPVVAWCLEVIARCRSIYDIVVVCEPDEREQCEQVARETCKTKLRAVVTGGDRRQDSVLAGLRASMPDADYVVIHDGARPFVTEDMIDRALAAAKMSGASVVAVQVKDTIKQVSDAGIVTRSLPRETLWAAQTPQAFSVDALSRAYVVAEAEGFVATDDAMLVEWAGTGQVSIVEGSYDNLKITTPDDLIVAEQIVRRRAASTA
ncbi:MAG TPA: 2-C-methyl-D-erythritol 4-phosphate cytidylyltransferase [Candidatus Eremiobacteraceae bacterium]|nr:2-C-methyl-D-erythritol 4-phosphate cytidylyltransferase [Candidatus Eremiobacteraceae bacterium]